MLQSQRGRKRERRKQQDREAARETVKYLASFEDGRMLCLVSKVWNAIGEDARDTSKAIVMLDHQFQEKTRNRDLTYT